MVYISPLGRNWGSTVNWDALGKIYAALAISWTVILFSGIAWLIAHRRLPYLKMRNIPLAVAATTFLHVYLVKILLAYTTNGHFPCSAEFWIMSIYLPFGIALFQANIVQLLSISTQQRKLLDGEKMSIGASTRHQSRIRGLLSKWQSLTALKKTYVFIGIGMLVQVVITAAIYGTSGKLQGHWGKLSNPAGQAVCRKGLEWIPSSFWQLFWSSIYGPYLLYKLRYVRDTHHWRLQTILSVISGIPGTPLWLAAVFEPKFKPINRYWVPPLWLAPGIIIMQACTVFFPIYSTYRSRHLTNNRLSALKAWEDRTRWGPDDTTLASHSSHARSSSVVNQKSLNSEKSQIEMYTMAALEHALATNPAPLLQFAATKDFTAENIIFLLSVRDWKASWSSSPPTPHSRALLFNQAVEIYAQSVNEKLALFPINIEGAIRARLDEIFSSIAKDKRHESRVAKGEVIDPFHEVTPFAGSNGDMIEMPLSPRPVMRSLSWPLPDQSSLPGTPKSAFGYLERKSTDKEVEEGLGEVVEGFDDKVFDAAEKSIKYLVVTNTWRKMVSAMRDGSPRSSEDTYT